MQKSVRCRSLVDFVTAMKYVQLLIFAALLFLPTAGCETQEGQGSCSGSHECQSGWVCRPLNSTQAAGTDYEKVCFYPGEEYEGCENDSQCLNELKCIDWHRSFGTEISDRLCSKGVEGSPCLYDETQPLERSNCGEDLICSAYGGEKLGRGFCIKQNTIPEYSECDPANGVNHEQVECSSGLICRPIFQCSYYSEATWWDLRTAYSCEKKALAKESCCFHGECEQGLVCLAFLEDPVCGSPGSQDSGDPCNTNLHCKESLVCHSAYRFNGLTGAPFPDWVFTCRQPSQVGEICGDDVSDCLDGLFCLNGDSDSLHVCTDGQTGSPCEEHHHCLVEDDLCIDGICTDFL